MDYFNFLLCAMGLSNSVFFDGWNPDFDLIGQLPLEISTTILRLLDGKTLLTAASTCKKWLRIIKSDRVLRKKVRDEFRARRMASIYYRPNRVESEGGRVLLGVVGSDSNGRIAGGSAERVMLPRMGVIGRKRKFSHEVGAIDKRVKVEEKKKTKKKTAETWGDNNSRLTTRLR